PDSRSPGPWLWRHPDQCHADGRGKNRRAGDPVRAPAEYCRPAHVPTPGLYARPVFRQPYTAQLAAHRCAETGGEPAMSLTLELAQSLTGSVFSLATADPQQPIQLRLDQVNESAAAGQYVQFSLLISGPFDTPLVQQ